MTSQFTIFAKTPCSLVCFNMMLLFNKIFLLYTELTLTLFKASLKKNLLSWVVYRIFKPKPGHGHLASWQIPYRLSEHLDLRPGSGSWLKPPDNADPRRQQCWLKQSGFCHSHGRSVSNYCLPVSAWSSPNCYRHLGDSGFCFSTFS